MENFDNDSQYVYEKPVVPTCLKVVAWLFIIGGVIAVIEIIVSLMNNHININLGVLGIFIGLGLLKLRSGWRTCGLVFIWIALVVLPVCGILAIANPSGIHYKIMGQNAGSAPLPIALGVVVFVFCVALWEYKVLTRGDIREMFLGEKGK